MPAPTSTGAATDDSSARPAAVSRRDERRQATIAEIKALARRQLAENGPGAVSLRAIAREMRVAPSALYRYFASFDELIGALCVDAYDAVADALAAARDTRPVDDHAGRWWALCHGYRSWSLHSPPDFALIFGTPVPGYHAPEAVTGPAAGRFVAVLLDELAGAVDAGAVDPDRTVLPDTLALGPLLHDLLQRAARECPPRLALIGLHGWASMLGYLVAEIFGSLGHLVEDTDRFFDAHVRTVMLGMGFDPHLTEAAAQQPS
jgi:AcrR family transcriptional regulator